MRFSILGPVEVTDHGRVLPLGGPRHRALLAAFLVRPRQVVSTDRLIDVLWGATPPRSAAEMLHVRISELRKLLRSGDEAGTPVTRRSAGYAVDARAGEVDAEVFEQLAAAGRRALSGRDLVEAANLLDRALTMWRGDPLPELAGRDFATVRITELSDLRQWAQEDAVEVDLLQGRHREACERLPAMIAEVPLRERPRRQLVLALYRSGRQVEALAEYDRFRALLIDELGVDPSPELQDLRVRILRQDPALSPAAPAPIAYARRTDNLPSPLTSFIGRTKDCADADRLLRTSRLVTVVGVGGAGKSRLAVEVARTHRDRSPGGIWLVELSPVADPDLIAPTTARVLGVPEHPDRSRFDQLVTALGDEPSLLILDNCEHLIEEVARFVTGLLRDCPRLRVICTSRERLRVAGESVLRLSGLPVPPHDDDAGLMEADAVRLFIERAAAVQPGLVLSAESAPKVAHVCRRLDGIPLAIELAAARAGTFSVAQIAARLADRFRLLDVGDRAGDDRHRTLRAVVDWSYDLLDDSEQVIFDGLAVFVGGFTFEAAEAVCALLSGDVDVSRVLDRLVDKSFVQAETPDSTAEYRYRLLETLRDYGAQDLGRRGLVESLRDRHAEFFLSFAKQAADGLRAADQPVWLERLTAEHDNLRAALAWYLDSARFEQAAQLAGAIYPFWDLCGHYAEGRQWLERVLLAEDLSRAVRTRALLGLATLSVIQGDAEPAVIACQEAESLSRAAGDSASLSHALGYQGLIQLWAEDFARAETALAEAAAAAEESAAGWELGWSWTFRATLALSREDSGSAVDCTLRSDEAFGPTGDLEAIGWNCLLRGGARWAGRDLPGARADLHRGLEIFARLGGVWGVSQGLMLAGVLLTSRRQFTAAARVLGAGDALRDLAGTGQLAFVVSWVGQATSEVVAALGSERARAARLAGGRADRQFMVAECLRLLSPSAVADR